MRWLILGSLLPALLVSWASAWAVRRCGMRWGLVDRPGGRKIHSTATPTGGGVAIWLGIIVPFAVGHVVLAWLPLAHHLPPAASGVGAIRLPAFIETHLPGLWQQAPKLWLMLGGGTVLLLLGLLDDRFGLGWKIRLAVQTAVALTMVLLGWRMTLFIDLPLVTGALSVLWIAGLVNSFNMLDNMDGLSAGVATIAAGILATVMLLAPDPRTNQPQLFVGGFLLVLVGALLGFLWHNRPPARLFMGDAGSYFVGYLLALATLMATFAGHNVPKYAILAPLCVLAVPLYDMVSVISIRLRAGRSPFEGDKSHFSHRLVELGLTKTQAVLTIYLATGACGLGAFLLHEVDTAGACIILLLVASMLVLIAILESAGRHKRAADSAAAKNPPVGNAGEPRA